MDIESLCIIRSLMGKHLKTFFKMQLTLSGKIQIMLENKYKNKTIFHQRVENFKHNKV